MVYVYLAFLYLWPQPLPWESFAIRSPEGYIVRLGAVMGHGFSSAWHPSGMGYPGTQIRFNPPALDGQRNFQFWIHEAEKGRGLPPLDIAFPLGANGQTYSYPEARYVSFDIEFGRAQLSADVKLGWTRGSWRMESRYQINLNEVLLTSEQRTVPLMQVVRTSSTQGVAYLYGPFDHVTKERAWRVRLLDAKGQDCTNPTSLWEGAHEFTWIEGTGEPVEFLIESAPVQWITFKNVALWPETLGQ